MKFVDFFAGIGGIRLGLEQAGHECVGFCEWDKYARTAYKAMYDTEGEWENHDVRTTRPYDVPDADLWCFGFPCQDISVAGKQKGLQEGERSGLFYEIMRLLAGRKKEDRPRWLLVENVKNLLSIGNGFDFARLLLEVGGVRVLSPMEFAKQQRLRRSAKQGARVHCRLSWRHPWTRSISSQTSRRRESLRTQRDNGGVSMADRIYDTDGISRTLAAVGGGGGAKTGLYAVKVVKPFETPCADMKIKANDNDLASTICARDYKGVSKNKGDAVLVRFRYPERGEGSREKGYMEQVDCASALTSKHCGDQTADCSNGVVCMSIKGQKLQEQIDVTPTIDTNCRNNLTRKQICCAVLTPDREEKRQNGRRMKEPGEPSFTLTAQDRHGVAIYQRPRGYNKGGMHDVAPALSISAWQENNLLTDSIRIRRLTPRECWRLQGFPDEYFDKAKAAGISDTQFLG